MITKMKGLFGSRLENYGLGAFSILFPIIDPKKEPSSL